MQSDTLEEGFAIRFCFTLGKIAQKRMECFRLLFDHLAWIEHQCLSGIRHSRKAGSLWRMMRGMGGVRKWIHQSWLAKGLGLSRQFVRLHIVQTLHPVTFAYSLSSEAVVMRQLRRWKGCDEGHWHAHTSMGTSRRCWNCTTSALQPEEITTKRTRVSCVYYQ